MKSLSGFTLIELITVMVILTILAIVCLPKYLDFSAKAQTTMTESVAAALSSANAENYATRTENKINGISIKNCSNLSKLILSGLPSGYKIKGAKVSVNVTIACVLKGPSNTQATFFATGIL